MRIIAVTNQKGGSSKTTTAVTLAGALAQVGQRVVVLDVDPQGHASIWLGQGDGAESLVPSLFEVFTAEAVPVAQVVRATSMPGLAVAPCDLRLANAELHLASEMGGELHLRAALEGLEQDFDLALIDCPPSLGLLVLNALCAATEVLIPLHAEYLSMDGLRQLLATVEKTRRLFNPSLRILGLLISRYVPSSQVRRETVELLREEFGDLVFDTVIGQDVRLEEAPGHRLTVFEYAPSTRSAQQFADLAQEVLGRGQ